MSARTWRDWSCTVRVVVGQDEPVPGSIPGSSPDSIPGSIPGSIADDAAAIVRALMAEVEVAASRFRADSEVELVNDAAPRLVPVSPLAVRLVEVALGAARRTDGAVDPTVGAHLRDLGYDDDIAVVRARGAARRPVGRRGGPGGVVVDHELGRVGVARGLRLDLGATAKAWTADEAARRVAERHGLPVLVEIGGDVAVAGPTARPWRVRVAESEGAPGEVVGLGYGGIATSSTTVRRWATTTGPAHHVVDPATGRPADGGVRTATVWAPSAVEANTWSTAAIVWGESAAARLALARVDARLVDTAGTVCRVGAWPEEVRAA